MVAIVPVSLQPVAVGQFLLVQVVGQPVGRDDRR